MADAHTNFAYSTITGTTSKNGSDPGTGGTSFTVQDGESYRFPPPPFNATVWPTGTQPTSTNAEVVRIVASSDDTFTVTRQAETGGINRNIVVGDQIAATITAKTLTDAEGPLTYWAPPPLLASSQSGLQTLASASGVTGGTASFYMFPVTIPGNLNFNQILIANSLSFISLTSNITVNNRYSSQFGIYSRNANTLSLISSNSFSIGETLSSTKATWNYPLTTATAGYSYGTGTGWSIVNQMSSYVSGMRAVGLQFGNSMSLTGGVYWLGLIALRSSFTNSSTAGLSNAGIMGQIINVMNQVGTVNGPLPIGYAASDWSSKNSILSHWLGRHIVGFVTSGGINSVPASVALASLGDFHAASTGTILPSVTFVST